MSNRLRARRRRVKQRLRESARLGFPGEKPMLEAMHPTRRTVLAGMAALALPRPALAADLHRRPIPATGELVPAVGMGTWITFNVGDDASLRAHRVEVLRRFFAMGGAVIDSSPMYGSSEAVVGHGLAQLGRPDALFSATKVWTPLAMMGAGQMADSRELWGVDRFDLMQVHNLLNWDGHLPTILEDKAAGRVRYVGITTSHGRRHDDFERLMASDLPLDAVQFTYNIVDREAEARLLPLAAERGLAVVINRPFRRGALFDAYEKRALPAWAAEIGAANWAQVFLKFVISHPAVTVAIPATSRVDHMSENMGALTGSLPDAALRRRMAADVADL
jgi:aryl-alcohol dehydrogenase-like predicted oxidoreductase